MTFANPWMFWFLVIPLGLILFEIRREGYRVPLPFDHGRQKQGIWLGRTVLVANLLPPLLLAAVIVLLAGPLRAGTPKRIRELTNIEFCLDVSGSMGSGLGEGTRYDAAMQAITDFTIAREGDAFGLTIFGNEVLRWTPLTKDLSALRNATPFLQPHLLPRHFGGTEIGKAIRFCRDTLTGREEGDRLIILLSDGHSADLGGNTPQAIGAELYDEDIMLYAIHIGSGSVPQQLYDMTWPTGGEVFAVDNSEGLRSVFEYIDSMKPVRLIPSTTENVDDFRLMSMIGLVLLGIYTMTLFGLRYTPW